MRPPLTMHSAMTMNLTLKYGSRRSQQPDNVNFEPIIRGLKVTFLTETKCKIRIILCKIQLQKKKSGVKNGWKLVSSRGGGGSDVNQKFPFCVFEPFLKCLIMTFTFAVE